MKIESMLPFDFSSSTQRNESIRVTRTTNILPMKRIKLEMTPQVPIRAMLLRMSAKASHADCMQRYNEGTTDEGIDRGFDWFRFYAQASLALALNSLTLNSLNSPRRSPCPSWR